MKDKFTEKDVHILGYDQTGNAVVATFFDKSDNTLFIVKSGSIEVNGWITTEGKAEELDSYPQYLCPITREKPAKFRMGQPVLDPEGGYCWIIKSGVYLIEVIYPDNTVGTWKVNSLSPIPDPPVL